MTVAEQAIERPATARLPANPERYATALANIHKARPRVDVDTWTENDAARFWDPEHDPESAMGLPSSMVTAVVARLFAVFYWDHPLLKRLFSKLRDDSHWLLTTPPVGGNVSFNLSSFCALVHASTRPVIDEPMPMGTPRSDAVEWVKRQRWLRDKPFIGYCGRKTCNHRHSVLRGCLPQQHYDALERQRWWRPWGSVQWTGLSTVLTPLRHSLETPYLSVQKERSHVRKAVVPFDTADALNNLHQLVPALLMAADFTRLVRDTLPSHLDRISSQRLRYSATVSLSGQLKPLLSFWDSVFTTACWDWEQSVRDNTYGEYMPDRWAVDYHTHRQLIDNTPADLFPVLPADSSSDS
jgi:hypothetical protein